MSTDEEAFDFTMQLVNSSILQMFLKAAIELDVFEIMAKAGPNSQLTAREIAAKIPNSNPEAPDMLERMLRLLTTHKVLVSSTIPSNAECDTIRRYSVAPMGKFLVKNEDGVSIDSQALFVMDKVCIDALHHIKDAVLEGGIPFEKAYCISSYEYSRKDPCFNKLFGNSMSNQSSILMKKILEKNSGFQGMTSLVDVGGGLGTNLSLITGKYPNIKGINFDLPHIIEHAPQFAGVEHIIGDMFVGVPKGDAIFMKWILHNWDDEHCLRLLKNCYDSLPETGKVILVEAVLPEIVDTSYASNCVFQMDCIMLAFCKGKERTQKEFEKLFKAAGFHSLEPICYVHNFWIIEVYKK